jgi:hypothetical protein
MITTIAIVTAVSFFIGFFNLFIGLIIKDYYILLSGIGLFIGGCIAFNIRFNN